MLSIEFTKNFAGRKKGEEMECDGLLASQLVNNDKVAVYTGESLEVQEAGIKATKAAKKAEDLVEEKRKDKLKEEAKAEAKIIKDAAKKAAKAKYDSMSDRDKEIIEAQKAAKIELKKLEEAEEEANVAAAIKAEEIAKEDLAEAEADLEKEKALDGGGNPIAVSGLMERIKSLAKKINS